MAVCIDQGVSTEQQMKIANLKLSGAIFIALLFIFLPVGDDADTHGGQMNVHTSP
jgi:hypothetical protein